MIIVLWLINCFSLVGIPEYSIFLLFKLIEKVTGKDLNKIRHLLKFRRAYIRFFCQQLGVIMGLNSEVSFEETYPENEPKILMTTHSSFFEVMTNMHKFPYYIVFLAKKAIFKYPFVSMFMSVTGHIPIDRTNKEESILSINLAADEIRKNNSSIGIYPEGTRRRRKSISHPR